MFPILLSQYMKNYTVSKLVHDKTEFYRKSSSNSVFTVLSTVFTQSIKYEKWLFSNLPRAN